MLKYLIILFLIFMSASFAQDKYFEMVRADFKADKVNYITEAMNLSDAESTKFWPIYREYDLKLSKIGDEMYMLIKDYAQNYNTMDNKKAEEIISKLFDLKQRSLDLKKKYFATISKALSPVVAAKFIQIENEIENFINVQINAQLPLIGENNIETETEK
jgi:predicted aspartyl protease